MACLREGERPNQNNISEPCSAHSVFLNADSGSRSWQTLLKLFWSYLKNWGTLILHINIHVTLHLMGWCHSCLDWNTPYKWMTNPYSKKNPKPSLSVDWHWAAPVFDTAEGMNWEHSLLHQNPVKEGGSLGEQSPNFAISSPAKARANMYRLHCGIKPQAALRRRKFASVGVPRGTLGDSFWIPLRALGKCVMKAGV